MKTKKRFLMCAAGVMLAMMAGTPFSSADITLKPGDVWTTSDEPFKQPVCLDNPLNLVGGVQFDVCEYVGGQPGDCMRCTDCELTERSGLFDCAVLELDQWMLQSDRFQHQPGWCD